MKIDLTSPCTCGGKGKVTFSVPTVKDLLTLEEYGKKIQKVKCKKYIKVKQ